MEQDEVAGRAQRDSAARALLAAEDDLLSEHDDCRSVRGERQHDQVGVQPVDAVPPSALARGADVLRDLVLAFSGAVGTREHDAQTAPQRVVLDLVADEVAQVCRHLGHEDATGSDAIRVELALALALLRVGSAGRAVPWQHGLGIRTTREVFGVGLFRGRRRRV